MAEALTILKGVFSLSLLVFSTIIIHCSIVSRRTKLSSEVNPLVACVALWGFVGWLTILAGSHGCLVGLAPISRELYGDSHEITHKCSLIAHNSDDSINQFLVGRQLMAFIVIFTLNMSGAPLKSEDILGLPSVIVNTISTSGLAMILFTCIIGQLNPHINITCHMLDFTNNYLVLFTLWVANLIEFSGLLHSCYVIQLIVRKLAGQPIESNKSLFFWFRCLMSLVILAFCITVTMVALFSDKTTMWKGVPPSISVVILFSLMILAGILDGMFIATFTVSKVEAAERGEGVYARKTCDILSFEEGDNYPRFLIGRQLLVIFCWFVAARMTSVQIPDGEDNIFGVSNGIQHIFNTGFLGAIMFTILGSISWQIVASVFPLAFMQSPITYVLLRICLGVECTGICQSAFVIAAIHRKIASFKQDDTYIGTAEERNNQKVGEDESVIKLGPKILETCVINDPSIGQKNCTYVDEIESQDTDPKLVAISARSFNYSKVDEIASQHDHTENINNITDEIYCNSI